MEHTFQPQLTLKHVSIKLKHHWMADAAKGNFSPAKLAKDVYLIKSSSFSIPEASLFAILGGSGSGKTTLLNVIAGRYDKNSFDVDGNIIFGQPSCSIGYVTQSDYLLPNLTVRETLLFTARLKINLADADIENLVTEVLLDLGLKECMDSLIGDNDMSGSRRGISGGEKRRVSVALQIISGPQVLCADEPTSGLDSFTAITVMDSLKRLTETRQTTVICSVHQPRADIFNIFHFALLLSKGGHTLYCGPTSEIVAYFGNLGYDCPVHANPADFFIDLVSVDNSTSEMKQESLARIDFLVTSHQANAKDVPKLHKSKSAVDHSKISCKETTTTISWFKQVQLLINRFLLNEYRDTSNITGGITQSIVLSVVCMAIFWNLPNDSAGISSKVGLLYIDVSMENYMLMVILIERYCRELKIFDRELQDELYRPSAYYIAHIISNLPLLILITICFSAPLYFGSGMRSGIEYFIVYALVNFTMIMVINGLVWMSVSLDRRFAISSLIANVSFTFVSLAAGFLVNYDTIPIYVRWVKDISFLSYGYRILMDNEFHGQTFTLCSSVDVQGVVTEECSEVTGDTILAQYGVGVNAYKYSWVVLIFIGLIYFSIAGVLLHYLRFPPTGSVASDLSLYNDEDDHDEETFDDMLSRYSEDTSSKRSIRPGDSLPSATSSTPVASESAINPSIAQKDVQQLPTAERNSHNPIVISSSQQRSSLKTSLLPSSIGVANNPSASKKWPNGETEDVDFDYEEDIDIIEGDIEENKEFNDDHKEQPHTKSLTSTEIRLLGGVVINVYKVDLFVKHPTDLISSMLSTPQIPASQNTTTMAASRIESDTRDSDISSSDLLRPSEGSTKTIVPRQKHHIPTTPATLSHNNSKINENISLSNGNKSSLVSSKQSQSHPNHNNYKKILHNISLEIRPGKLVAIMGGSGSGKTTLLNLIANRIPQTCLVPHHPPHHTHQNNNCDNEAVRNPLNGQQGGQSVPYRDADNHSVNPHQQQPIPASGPFSSTVPNKSSVMTPLVGEPNDVLYNGRGGIYFNSRIPSQRDVRRLIGYVQQFDFHLPSLTVLETLVFQAKLRLHPPSLARYRGKRRQQYQEAQCFYRRRVERVLKTLGLQGVRHVRVGDEDVKGISGGEKRRLSIGIQLLSNPAICLLDEPTTGLDAFTARKIVLTLRDLVQGRLFGLCQTTNGNSLYNRRAMFQSTDMYQAPTRTTEMSETMHPSFVSAGVARDTNSSGFGAPSSNPSQSSAVSDRKTVILSIHQPRYDIFAVIDEVILLSRGQLVWSGNSEKMLDHFQKIGFTCPPLVNPADFILDLSSIDFRSYECEVESRQRLTHLVDAFRRVQDEENALRPFVPPAPLLRSIAGTSQYSSARQRLASTGTWHTRISSITMTSALMSSRSSLWSGSNQSSHFHQHLFTNRKSFLVTYFILLYRGFLNLTRQPALLFNRVSQCIFYALILSCFYAPLGDDQVSIQNRIGLLYELTPLSFIGMLNCIAIFPTERGIFFREYVDGYYPAFAFIAAYFTIALPIMFTGAVGIAILVTYATGLAVNVASFIKFAYVIFLFIATGESVGVAFCMAYEEIGFAVNIMSAIFSLFSITAGFISLNMPLFLIDISYVSPLRWGAYILANTAFAGESFVCGDDDLQSSGGSVCALSTGEDVLSLYGFTGNGSIRFHYLMVTVTAAFYFVICWLVFRWRAYKLSH